MEIFRRTQTATGGSERGRQLQESRRFYATKMICCMVAGFFICTIPIMILLFLKVAENIPPKVGLVIGVCVCSVYHRPAVPE